MPKSRSLHKVTDPRQAITPVRTQIKLAQGIEAAKNGDRTTAQDLLYDVLEQDPKNEAAWVWLSYVVDSIPDRRVCLENVLVINPANKYALKGLAALDQLTKKQQRTPAVPKPAQQSSSRSLPLSLIVAFWAGLGVLFLSVGLIEGTERVFDLLQSRNFPYYITPTQLWGFTIATGFLVGSIVALNVAWALFAKNKIGYFSSIVLSLGLILIGPTIMLIPDTPHYLFAIVSGIIPTVILFLTLLSQTGFGNERKMASDS